MPQGTHYSLRKQLIKQGLNYWMNIIISLNVSFFSLHIARIALVHSIAIDVESELADGELCSNRYDVPC